MGTLSKTAQRKTKIVKVGITRRKDLPHRWRIEIDCKEMITDPGRSPMVVIGTTLIGIQVIITTKTPIMEEIKDKVTTSLTCKELAWGSLF